MRMLAICTLSAGLALLAPGSLAAQEQQQRQALLQKYDRAYSACLTGRGYTVQ